jgi:hypothetical protein
MKMVGPKRGLVSLIEVARQGPLRVDAPAISTSTNWSSRQRERKDGGPGRGAWSGGGPLLGGDWGWRELRACAQTAKTDR